jgi:hypothetical protein
MIDILTDEQFVTIFLENFGIGSIVAKKISEQYGIACTQEQVMEYAENFPGLIEHTQLRMMILAEKKFMAMMLDDSDPKIQIGASLIYTDIFQQKWDDFKRVTQKFRKLNEN